jgi:F-type H+-transporting ATPase subunit a
VELHIEVAPETLWTLPFPGGELRITNSFLTMLVVMAVLVLGGALIARSATLIPGRLQSVIEMVVEFLLGVVEGSAGKRLGRQVFPLIGSLFIFIIVANYTGLLPGVGTFGLKREIAEAAGQHGSSTVAIVPLFRSPSADLNMTLSMALLSYLTFQILGIRSQGVRGRLKHMATPFFIFPIEVISELSRIVSLGFRLFGNIFAGETLMTVMYAIANAIKITVVGLLVPVIFLYLEVLFGFIQALIFSILTLIYIVLAAGEAHGHGEAGH